MSDMPQSPLPPEHVPTQPVEHVPTAESQLSYEDNHHSSHVTRNLLLGLLTMLAFATIAYGSYTLGQKNTTKQVVVTPSPTTIPVSPTIATTSATTPIPSLTSTPLTTYTDKYLGYTISYPKSGWYFRRTYGPDISKLAPTDILSGFDITFNVGTGNNITTQATVVGNVLDSHGFTDVEKWIDTYDLNYPKNATRTSVSFAGHPALKYTDDTSNLQQASEYLYFLSGKYAYRITYVERPVIRNATRDIINSFKP